MFITNKKLIKPIAEFIKLLEEVKEEQYTKIMDIEFSIYPGVFSPIYSSDTEWFARKITPMTKGKSFLEIGSGTGVIACLAVLNGASQVLATDINQSAIDNIRHNARLHSLNIDVRLGSVFEPINNEERFDLVFWNHPFFYSDDKNIMQNMHYASICDFKYQFIEEFFANGEAHLKENGKLILGTSNVANLKLIEKIANKYGFISCLLEKIVVPIYKEQKIQMDLRLYSFSINNQSIKE